jgi:hypothetical protein
MPIPILPTAGGVMRAQPQRGGFSHSNNMARDRSLAEVTAITPYWACLLGLRLFANDV